MKKLMFLAAIAAAVLTGCTSDDAVLGQQNPVVADEATPVEFGVYTNTTRASVIDITGVKASGIGLFAFEQGTQNLAAYSKANYMPNFMFNQKLTFHNGTSADDTYWEYTPKKYWPNTPNAKVSFFAYAPYEAGFSDDTHIQTPETNSYLSEITPVNGQRLILAYDQNGPGIEYTVASDPTKGTDLMWGALDGTVACPSDLTKPDVTSKINLQMKHALSRLAFEVQVITDDVDGSNNQALAAGTSIKIKRVSLIGKFASKGTLRLYDGKWLVANGDNQTLEFVENPEHVVNPSTDAERAKNAKDQFALTVEEGIELAEAISPIPLLKTSAPTTQNPTPNDNYVMAIPAAKFYIEVEYDVITTDDNNTKNSSTVKNVISTIQTDPTNGYYELVAGTAYKFVLRLGMTSVKFDVTSATDWNDQAVTYVDLPKNEAPSNP